MKRNPVKSRIRSQPAASGHFCCRWEAICRHLRNLARVGFPWLTVDMEHSPIGLEQASNLFGVIRRSGLRCRSRASPWHPRAHQAKFLDGGAWGVVIPMANTVEEAKLAIAAAKYPPVGNRSIGGGLHALNFDAAAGDYYKRANDEVLVVLQTESPQGVENAEAIYSLPGVDAIFVGPNDLQFQMKTPDGVDPTPEQLEAMLVTHAGDRKKSRDAGRPACADHRRRQTADRAGLAVFGDRKRAAIYDERSPENCRGFESEKGRRSRTLLAHTRRNNGGTEVPPTVVTDEFATRKLYPHGGAR